MKMLKYSVVLLILGGFLAIAGCGSTQVKTENDAVHEYEPDWYFVQAPEESDYIIIFGEGEGVQRSSAINDARARALNEASMYVKSYVSSRVRLFNTETGVTDPEIIKVSEEIIDVLSKTDFSGLGVIKQETVRMGNTYRTYVALALPKSNVDDLLIDQAKRNKALYERWIRDQGFQDMEEALKQRMKGE